MPLPQTAGWIIDYPAAYKIFDIGNLNTLPVVHGMCRSGNLFFANCEKPAFIQHQHIKSCFLQKAECCCYTCFNVAEIIYKFPEMINGKRFNRSDDSQKIIGAIAIYNNFGVISDKSGMFVTCGEIAATAGLPVLDSEQFGMLV